jgi:hypothetical protein
VKDLTLRDDPTLNALHKDMLAPDTIFAATDNAEDSLLILRTDKVELPAMKPNVLKCCPDLMKVRQDNEDPSDTCSKTEQIPPLRRP